MICYLFDEYNKEDGEWTCMFESVHLLHLSYAMSDKPYDVDLINFPNENNVDLFGV